MLDLRRLKRVAIIGGGTAGWFAAITFRRIFHPTVQIVVLEDPKQGIIGVGEGGLLNLVGTLIRNNIDVDEFYRESGASFKLGITYENWAGLGHQYHHLFAMSGQGIAELDLENNGIMPLFAARISSRLDLHSCFPGFSLIRNNASQIVARTAFDAHTCGLAPSMHFDSYKMANYLKKIAVERGVINKHVKVEKLLLTADGLTHALATNEGILDVDFVVDASGLKRLGIGNTYKQKWRSFSDQLITDRAIPFPILTPNKNPHLVTKAIAMESGWMWQIPLHERTGAGYVFSSQHIDEDGAVREAEKLLKQRLDPRGVIKFDPGHYERVWCKNVVALGLSSGFVEPLEATSIGQMLEELRNLEKILIDVKGIITDSTIESFNRSNLLSWNEIRDFLRLHYDTKRNDTPFWRDMKSVPYSAQYQDLKNIFQYRFPRRMDIESYVGTGWAPIFHMINWLLVAAPLGIVTPNAAQTELESLPKEFISQYIIPYLEKIRSSVRR